MNNSESALIATVFNVDNHIFLDRHFKAIEDGDSIKPRAKPLGKRGDNVKNITKLSKIATEV